MPCVFAFPLVLSKFFTKIALRINPFSSIKFIHKKPRGVIWLLAYLSPITTAQYLFFSKKKVVLSIILRNEERKASKLVQLDKSLGLSENLIISQYGGCIITN